MKKLMTRSCVYIVNDHPFYKKMVANSIEMLRKHSSINVKLIYIEDQGKQTLFRKGMSSGFYDLLNFCEQHSVEIIKKDPIQGDYFHANRSYLQELEEDQILFIDGDTFIYGDVEVLFEKYQDKDFVARESRWMESVGWDSNKIIGKNLRPFNSGVMLWKNEWLKRWAGDLLVTFDKLLNGNHAPSKFLKEKTSEYHREEVSVTLFISENELKYDYLTEQECYIVENPTCFQKLGESLIYHTFADQWSKVYSLSRKDNPTIKPKYLRKNR